MVSYFRTNLSAAVLALVMVRVMWSSELSSRLEPEQCGDFGQMFGKEEKACSLGWHIPWQHEEQQ